jgi:hypothetical protein
MKLWSLFVLSVVSLVGVFSAGAEEMQCFVGWALVMNGAEDQTEDVRGGIVYELNSNLHFGPLGASVEVLPGAEVEVFTPETFLPAGAIPIEVYLSGAIETGTLDVVISPCATAPNAGANAASFRDGRLNPNGADTAVVYASGGEYAVWGVAPDGSGVEAFRFTCAGLQTALSSAQTANGNYLLSSAAAPGRSGDIQLWAVPGNGGALGLVLVSPGQGGDSSKQTIVPLSGLCPNLTAA